MTLANRMGQSANCVSRFAFGMLGALAVGTALLIAPSAKAEQTAAPASVAPVAIPRAEGSGPPLWVLRDADSTIYLYGPLQAGYRPDAGVDKTLMDRARSTGKTLRGFETADIQVRLIAGMSEEAQIAYLNHYVRNTDGIVPNLDQTVEAWIKGDVAEVGRLTRYNTGDVHADVHRAALIVRNENWVRQIEDMMAGSGTVFVAVGAAHLMDNDSVIDMLTAKGFTVERL